MKRKLSVFLAVLILMSCTGLTAIFAQVRSVEISAEVSVQNNAITVSGIISSGANQSITMLVTQHGVNSITGSDIMSIDQNKSGENGRFEFSFIMPNRADYGIYIAKLGGSGITNPITIPFAYKPNDESAVPLKITDSGSDVHNGFYNSDKMSVRVKNTGNVEFVNRSFNDGPVFAGWYSDSDFITPVSNGTLVNSGDILYSKIIGIKGKLEMTDTEIRTTGTQALRFIARISTDFRSEMIDLHSDNYAFDPTNENFNNTKEISYGLLMLPTKFLGGRDMIKGQEYTYMGRTFSPSVVNAKMTYAEEPGYVLYTAALVAVDIENYKREYSTRPYVTYKDASGVERTVHGPTIVSTVYDTAKRIIEENTASSEIIEYLQTNIIDAYDAYVNGQTLSTSVGINSTTVNDYFEALDNDIPDTFEPLDDRKQKNIVGAVSDDCVSANGGYEENCKATITKRIAKSTAAQLVGNESSYTINKISFRDQMGNEIDKPTINGKVSGVSVTQNGMDSLPGVAIVSLKQKNSLKQIKSVDMSETTQNSTVDYDIDLSFESEYENLSVKAMVWENFETMRPLAEAVSENFGSMVHISSNPNTDCIISVNDSGISKFEDIVYSVEYDASMLRLTDCIANTPNSETEVGTYGDITIIEIEEGIVRFKSNLSIPNGKRWSGVVNRLKFTAIGETDTCVYVSK